MFWRQVLPQTTDDPNDQSAIERMKNSYAKFTQMMRQGNSFSGHERNCAFLNLGARSSTDGGPVTPDFANISSVSGFDFIDDARGLAISDWDLDGDLDVVVTNRTAPRIRFLRNDLQNEHHFVSFRLTGTESNRDAVGARVQVRLSENETPIARTLRAGNSFLSQSSKRLTFGLGAVERIHTVTVDWPSGLQQTFHDVAANTFYELTEGSDELTPETIRPASEPLARGGLPAHDQSATARAICYPRFRLPITEWIDVHGQRKTIELGRARYTLINLWASWCEPCKIELKAFNEHRSALQPLGLEIVALSTDGQDGRGTGVDDARKAAQQLGIEFTWGSITEGWLEKWTLLRGDLFGLQQPLPMPSSILVDSQGDVRLLYLGVVPIDQLKRDLAWLEEPDSQIRNHLSELTGRWMAVTRSIDNLKLAGLFDGAGFASDAKRYDSLAGDQKARNLYQRALTALAANDVVTAEQYLNQAIDYDDSFIPAHLVLANVMVRLAAANQATRRSALQTAEREYAKVLKLDPDHFDALVGWGTVLVRTGRLDQAIEPLRRAVKQKPDSWQTRTLLGRALAQQNDLKGAVAQMAAAWKQKRDLPELTLEYASLLTAIGETDRSIEVLKTHALADRDPRFQKSLADNYLSTGDWVLARDGFQRALQAGANDPQIQLKLAWILATAADESLRDPGTALSLARTALPATASQASARQTLAAALAANHQFPAAVEQQSIALQILSPNSTERSAAEKRLQQYRENQPFIRQDPTANPFRSR